MSELITKDGGEFLLSKFDVQTGQISAIVTSFKNYDVVNDVIKPGALDEFIKNFDGGLPMLFQHAQTEIIGEWTKFTIKGDLVIGEGQIYPEVSRGADTMALISRGMIGSTSIGFRANEYEFNEKGGRDFSDITLFEVSMVQAPANPKARLLAAKAREGDFDIKDFQDFLRQAGMTRKDTNDVMYSFKEHLRQAGKDEDNITTFKQLLRGNTND